MHCFAPRQVSINHKLQFPATLLQRYASPFDALVSSPVIYKEFATQHHLIFYVSLKKYKFPCMLLKVGDVESYLKLKRELSQLKYLLSEASLHLLPEYQQRVQVRFGSRRPRNNVLLSSKGLILFNSKLKDFCSLRDVICDRWFAFLRQIPFLCVFFHLEVFRFILVEFLLLRLKSYCNLLPSSSPPRF